MRTRRIVALSDICVGGLVSNIRPTERHSSLDTQVEEMQLDVYLLSMKEEEVEEKSRASSEVEPTLEREEGRPSPTSETRLMEEV